MEPTNQPADGRGRSAGSRRTQFQPGHIRMGGRQKAKPDLVKLLEQVCDGVRGSDSPQNLSALRTKLEELNQRLGVKAGSSGAQGPEPESNLPRSKGPSFMICRGCLGQVIIEQSKLEPGAFLHHGCGARIRVGSDGGLYWF